MTSRLNFELQSRDISIEHGNNSFKFSDLLINNLYLPRVLVKASAFGLQLLDEHPQPRRQVSVAFVFLRHSQIHLLQQFQLVVRALTRFEPIFCRMSTILFGSSENLKIPGKIIIERKNLELGFDHGKDAGEEIVKRLGELVAIRLHIVLLGHFWQSGLREEEQ